MVLLYISLALGAFFVLLWCSQLVFFRLCMNRTYRVVPSGGQDEDTGVSVIHVMDGPEPGLERNLESWFRQNYAGPVQHIFCFRDSDDPAVPAVQKVITDHPGIDCRIIMGPAIPGPDSESSVLAHAMKLAGHGIILFADSYARVRQDFIVRMVRPLKAEKTGMTVSVRVSTGGADFRQRFSEFALNTWRDFTWAFLVKLGAYPGAAGTAFAIRKELLQEIGQPGPFGSALSGGIHPADILHGKGYRLVLGPFMEYRGNRPVLEGTLDTAGWAGTGKKARAAFGAIASVLVLSWYWILFFLGFISANPFVVYLSVVFMSLRVVHGLLMRSLTDGRIMLVDVLIPLYFDLSGTFRLIFRSGRPAA